jgi:hypothetical protein
VVVVDEYGVVQAVLVVENELWTYGRTTGWP